MFKENQKEKHNKTAPKHLLVLISLHPKYVYTRLRHLYIAAEVAFQYSYQIVRSSTENPFHFSKIYSNNLKILWRILFLFEKSSRYLVSVTRFFIWNYPRYFLKI